MKKKDFTVAFTGSAEIAKEQLADAVKRRLDAVLKRDITIVRGDIEHSALDPQTTVQGGLSLRTVFAIEGAYLEVEKSLVGRPKLFCRSIIDRYATVRAHGLKMDMHFERSLAKHVAEYDLLVYCPADSSMRGALFLGEDSDFSLSEKVDKEIRLLVRENKLPIQLVLGTVQARCDLVVQSVKLKLGMAL